MRLDENGDPQPDCAESWEMSADGLTYTFTLKEGLTWRWYRARGNDFVRAVEARDFVFAFQRVFSAATASPYAQSFSCIQGGPEALQGIGSLAALGVEAPDERTVVFRLSKADPDFLRKLCLPGAMPCNQEFFENTSGSYGLAVRQVLGNGPFYLYNWTNEGLFLRRSASGKRIDNLRLVLKNSTETDAAALVADGKSSAELTDDPNAQGLPQRAYLSTTWCLLLRCSGPLADRDLRAALAQAAYGVELPLPDGCTRAQGLVPPAVTSGGGSYREAQGSALPQLGDALSLYQSGLQRLGLSSLKGISILAPEGSQYTQLVGYLNEAWQKQFSAFFTVRQLPQEEFQAAIEQGDYDIALYPLSPTSDDALELCARFGQGGLAGLADEAYDAALAALQRDPARATPQAVAALERQLLDACPVVPLFYQSRYLLIDPAVQGLVFRPFGPVLDVSGASLA